MAPTSPAGGPRAAAEASVRGGLASLTALSHEIHRHPETCFEERWSAAAVAGALAEGGMEVTEGICDLPTAFSARAGSGPLVVAVCAEYDALPGVGHACGHNIIAAAAVGAGLALAEVADDVGMTVLVLGTPAEEGGGGKVHLLNRGAFDGVHTAMMVHPWSEERLTATCLAVSHFDVRFTGLEAHASAAPWEGVNALDALTVSQAAIGLLRQHLRPGDQVHGVVTDGGRAANVIPGASAGRFMCRSRTMDGLIALEPRVRACFEAGALATGCTVAYEELSPAYSHMEPDMGLLTAYRFNAEALGRTFDLDDAGVPAPTLSTDMANVSLTIPSIHPLVAIESGGAVNHQPAFAAACITPSADDAVRDGALAMAWTAIDAATDTALPRPVARPSGVNAVAGTPSEDPEASGAAVLEHAVLDVLPGEEAAFELAFAEARRFISAAEGFTWLRLERCLERPSRYLLLVGWASLESHTEGFRGSPDFEEWRRLLHHFYDPFPTVEHFTEVARH